MPGTVSDITSSFPSSGRSEKRNGIDALQIEITLNRTVIPSSGAASVAINVTDGTSGSPGITLNLSITRGTLTPNLVVTDGNGSASMEYRAPALNATTEVTLTVVANEPLGNTNSSTIHLVVLSAIDQAPPSVIYISPAVNSTDIELNSSILVEFSEPMNESSVALALVLDPNFTSTLSWNHNNLTIAPTKTLLASTRYELEIGSSAKDSHDNSISPPFRTHFITRAQDSSMTLTTSIVPREIAEGSSGKLSVKAKNETGHPVDGVNLIVTVSGGANAGPGSGTTDIKGYYNITISAPEVETNTIFIINITASKARFHTAYEELGFFVLDRKTFHLDMEYPALLFSGENHIISSEVSVRQSDEGLDPSLAPVDNASVYLNCSAGGLHPDSGLTGPGGIFNSTFTAPEVTEDLKINFSLKIVKNGFLNHTTSFSMTIRPLSEHIVEESVMLDNGTSVTIRGAAIGTLAIDLTETENPSPFTEGFLGTFIMVRKEGSGTLMGLNATIRFDPLPPDTDVNRTALYYLEYRGGPWLRFPRTGILPVQGTIWGNMSWHSEWNTIYLAPRTRLSGEVPRTTLVGSLADEENRSIGSMEVHLHRSGVRIRTSVTDSRGEFLFDAIDTGTYEIEIEDDGYGPYSSGEITVVSGENRLGIIILRETEKEPSGEEKREISNGLYWIFIFLFFLLMIPIVIKMILLRKEGGKYGGSGERTGSLPPGRAAMCSSGAPFHGEADPNDEYECPVCGSGVHRDATGCPVCRVEFVKDKYICPDCGMPILPRDPDCRMCGTVFGVEARVGWSPPSTRKRTGKGHEPIEDFEIIRDDDA